MSEATGKNKKGKILIITAPSGSGKTTIVRHLLNKYDCLDFSVSATTREKRHHEIEGKDYFFLTVDEFKAMRRKRKFVEWEEVYPGKYYGTLKSEVENVRNTGKTILFDIEVKGATNLKKLYGDEAMAVFVKVPSLRELVRRLKARNTETEDSLKKRIRRIKRELTYENSFDEILVNDELEKTLQEAEALVEKFVFGKKSKLKK